VELLISLTAFAKEGPTDSTTVTRAAKLSKRPAAVWRTSSETVIGLALGSATFWLSDVLFWLSDCSAFVWSTFGFFWDGLVPQEAPSVSMGTCAVPILFGSSCSV
jgi:hypothetical protein